MLRIEGIKTPSSALAYMEMFFEEYDWEAFSYAQVVSVSEMDSLANSLKSTPADDKKTWLFCFDAIFIPYIKNIADASSSLTKSLLNTRTIVYQC